tara:strand:+ start:223 stop:522 length:300 start_codon:yes stop_codon:yes gene_type:complete
MNINNDLFNILRKLHIAKNITQRKLAKELGMSLGKLNYCLKELKKKGLIKVKNFQQNKDKLRYIYLLTPKGISQKTKLTLKFMKKKMKEFEELNREINS